MDKIVASCLKVLSKVEKEIPLKDLINKVSKDLGGYRTDTIRGRLFHSDLSFENNKDLYKEWKVVKNPTIICRKKFYRNRENYYTPDYLTPQKLHSIREMISCLASVDKKSPKVLTLASSTATCVKEIYKMYPKAKITNVERDERVLKKYKKLNLKTEDHLVSLEAFLKKEALDFDFINLDLMGHAGNSKGKMFQLINDRSECQYVSVNFLYSTKFRISKDFPFMKEINKKYKNVEDQVLEYTKDCFPDFKLIKEFKYKRNPEAASAVMRVLCFERIY